MYPLEIERSLAVHPAVGECAVLAVEDEHRLTAVAAFVALKDGQGSNALTRELQKFVRERLLQFKYRAESAPSIACRGRERAK